MCGRFALDAHTDELIKEFVFETGEPPENWRSGWEASWNISPTQNIPLLFESTSKDGTISRRFETAYWSLVPGFSKTLKMKYPTFNARAEGIMEKATWKRPVQSHRGIVPANGYYEWQGERGHKIPYFIRNPEDPIIGFAALYSWWPDPQKSEDDDSRWTLTATILTSDAVKTLADIHDRNPVILPKSMWSRWVDRSIVGSQELVDESVSAGVEQANRLIFDQVAPVIGDGPELVRPLTKT